MTTTQIQDIISQQLFLLHDTATFYGHDPAARRSVSGKYVHCYCMYRGEEGKTCAVGRFIPDEKYDVKMESLAAANQAVQDALPPDLQRLGPQFWNNLQELHDTHAYWTGDGLSGRGRTRLKDLDDDIKKGTLLDTDDEVKNALLLLLDNQ